jgi:hypothetical protein
MPLHILKKDWKLLWPFVAALGILHGLAALARFNARHFLNFPSVPVSLLQLLGTATLIVLVVHQDPIPGVRQDWLVRPIPRRDLLLAKLLFVVLLVQGPWWIADLLQGLANGFPVRQSAAAATACAAWVLLTLTLPVLAFATLTATMTETLVAALGVFAVLVAFLVVPGQVGATRPAALTGFAWVTALERESLLLVAAAGVLTLQYRRRRTGTARALFAAMLIVGLSVAFLPWHATFRLEQLLTASSRSDDSVTIAFAPSAGRFRPPMGQGLDDVVEKPGFGQADVAAENQRRRAEGARTVFIPVRLAGLVQDSRLLADRSEITITTRDRRVVHQGAGNDLELRPTDAETTIHQGVRVPGAIYGRVKTEPVDVALDYWFTTFQASATYTLPAQDGDRRLPGIGWCVTKVDDAGTRVQLGCMQPGERPSCLAVVLEHTPTGQRNPEVSLCAPDYSPYPGHVLPDALARFGGRLPFYDPSGLVRFPVGGPQLSESRVVITDFRPTSHFVRRVLIPAVRLEDWEPLPPAALPE